MVIICIYVDDLIIRGDDDVGIKNVKAMLNVKFKISEL